MKVQRFFCFLFACICLFNHCGKKTPVEPSETPLKYTDCPISPGGGTYPVGPDLVITVPEGAVQSDMTIQIAKLDRQVMKRVFSSYDVADFPAVAGFDVKPAGAEFSKPVTFTFKSVPYDAPYIPLTHTVDLSIGAHSIEQCVTLVDNDSDSLSVSVMQSGSYIVEALAGWPGLAKPSGVAGCREGVIQVECIDKDNYCTTQNCQITESSVKVQFLTCDGQPIESAIMREKSGGCIAALTLTPGASSIAINSSTSINAELKIGCAVTETPQTLALTVAGPATINPASIATGTDGKASATLSSGDTPGTAVVTASAGVRYAAREIIINGSVEESLYRIEEDVTAQTSVEIKDVNRWKGNIVYERIDSGIWVETSTMTMDMELHEVSRNEFINLISESDFINPEYLSVILNLLSISEAPLFMVGSGTAKISLTVQSEYPAYTYIPKLTESTSETFLFGYGKPDKTWIHIKYKDNSGLNEIPNGEIRLSSEAGSFYVVAELFPDFDADMTKSNDIIIDYYLANTFLGTYIKDTGRIVLEPIDYPPSAKVLTFHSIQKQNP